ncbi:hypothetical protein MUK42_19331 [Musa troglodytarum]|uniref:Uncharacterized protein n=1 Tax=Musa troglodytarum TaxID=320322 RepID=A0A9E7G7R1_9LILI|nr:hypothetical protein MUK42_19331 [Musa troglodytarum]
MADDFQKQLLCSLVSDAERHRSGDPPAFRAPDCSHPISPVVSGREAASPGPALRRRSEGHGAAVGASDEAVLVALGAGPEAPGLVAESPVAAAARGAEDEAHAAAGLAGGCHGGGSGPLDEGLELAGLVEAADLVGATEAAAGEEDLGEGGLLEAQGGLELGEEAGVHGEVALVDGDAEAAEDGADGAAVLEGAADDAEGGEVEDDAAAAAAGVAVRIGDGGAKGAEGGGGKAGTVEDAAEGGRRGRGRIVVVAEDGLEVPESRGGEGGGAADGAGGSGGSSGLYPRRPHGEAERGKKERNVGPWRDARGRAARKNADFVAVVGSSSKPAIN